MAAVDQYVKHLFLGVIHCYRKFISPMLGPRCRFYPSCSYYAIEAIEKYGLIRGSGLMLKRLVKCHPGHPGGIDYVP